MRIFFAACEPTKIRKVLGENGGKNVLCSFYSLGCGKQAPPQDSWIENFILDSGGYSARVHGIDIDVRKYAAYLNYYKVKFAFNLDVLDLEQSLKNFYYLMDNTHTYIIPIYHGPEWINPETRGLIDYYCDCYPFIALGGIAGREISEENSERFLQYVFARTRNKVKVHGLGSTKVSRLKKYPFFCVDSTSWMGMSKFASSAVYSKEMAKVRAKNNHYTENLSADIKYWLNIENDMTRLWESRGIEWDELDYDKMMAERKTITYEEWKEKNGQ